MILSGSAVQTKGFGFWLWSATRIASTCPRRRGNEMRMFVAFLIVLSVVYFWDVEYNNGTLSDGLRKMGRSMSHNMVR
jgi:hypothetical protein